MEQLQQDSGRSPISTSGAICGRIEAGIGGLDILFQFGVAEGAAGEARQDGEGHVLIGLALEGGDLGGAKAAASFRGR